MNRDHQLQYCKICINKQFDPQQGIVCVLTGKQAEFENYCPTFKSIDGTSPESLHYENKTAFVPERVLASTTKRFFNMVIDYIVFYLLMIAFVFVSAMMAALLFPEETETLLDENSSGSQVWIYVLVYLAYVSYYTTLEAASGRTVGKLITGTRVVDKDGKLPSVGAIFRRSLSRLVPFEAFSFLGNNARGWHDAWTDTWVIEKK
ncbi:MAG: RDD family protein [Cyclobacteriaceae bacterium]|nr:RDD family protein [Cyclobacteriaceae bacterium]